MLLLSILFILIVSIYAVYPVIKIITASIIPRTLSTILFLLFSRLNFVLHFNLFVTYLLHTFFICCFKVSYFLTHTFLQFCWIFIFKLILMKIFYIIVQKFQALLQHHYFTINKLFAHYLFAIAIDFIYLII